MAPKTKDKVAQSASAMRPYIERALSDAELRENLKDAFSAAREAYVELLTNRGSTAATAKKVATDKEIQDSLRTAVDELRKASERARGKKSHASRNATLLLGGITLGILLNPTTGPAARQWVRDKVFGDGEEFEFPAADEIV